jgi:hypothetical protein
VQIAWTYYVSNQAANAGENNLFFLHKPRFIDNHTSIQNVPRRNSGTEWKLNLEFTLTQDFANKCAANAGENNLLGHNQSKNQGP